MRNNEVIRQWNLLRTLEASRQGVTVDALARELGVTKRTIWRDVDALQAVGFPLTSERDGRQTRWRLMGPPFKGLAELGVSTLEMCSLYMGRAMVDGLAGAPFGQALRAFCGKLEDKLPPRMREFLDRLPALLEAKPGIVKKRQGRQHERYVEQLIAATHERHVCRMRYFSASRGRAKTYDLHPYRLAHAHGGMYLIAWVPEYGEFRTFAIERIQKLSLTEQRFTMQKELPADVFAHSLGVHRGKPERVVISFAAKMATYVREHVWHKSQKIMELPDGGVRVTLTVSIDAPLKTWVLGFGGFAKVESPQWLAEEILEQLDAARDAYIPRLELALPTRVFAIGQPRLIP